MTQTAVPGPTVYRHHVPSPAPALADARIVIIVGEQLGPHEWRGVPDLPQLIPSGGRPGVEYCLIPPVHLGTWQRDGWWIVPRIEPLTIHGPTGSADGVLLLGWGTPIPGASPSNGRRHYYAHEELLVELGYVPSPAPPADLTALRAETSAHKSAAVGAARAAVDRRTAATRTDDPGAA